MSAPIEAMFQILPEKRIMADELRRLAYGTAASFYRLIPEVVVFVECETNVHVLQQAAQARGRTLTFRAAGTSLSGQAVTDGVLALVGEGFATCMYAEQDRMYRVELSRPRERIGNGRVNVARGVHKIASAVIAPLDGIECPPLSNRVDYEGELAVVIWARTKTVSRVNAKEHILGYTCANDVTVRNLQPQNGQRIIVRGFDTMLPLGSCIETEAAPVNLNVKTYLNGKIRQSSITKNLIFDAYTQVRYISQVMALNPGDVILTATPAGISPMKLSPRSTGHAG